MVLQQESEVSIWGKSSKDGEVRIPPSWDQKVYAVKVDSHGRWKTKIQTPVAGGPYSISLSDGDEIQLENVLIGEVWVCSGQSNMEMPLKGFHNQPVTGSNLAIARSGNQQIRLLTIKKNHSLKPLDDLSEQWQECSPSSSADFSATAYYFGKMLQETLNVPVGLICTSWGGSKIEAWMSKEKLQEFDFVDISTKDSQIGKPNHTPMLLYNAMLAPIKGYGIRGAIWYQGESNVTKPQEYEKLFPALIENWRSNWNIGEFPFYFVQIAPYSYGGNTNSAYLRESQLKVAESYPNVGMACLMDAGEKHCIHPANKEAGGTRLALQALVNTYHMGGIECSGPVLKEMEIDGSVVKLTFDHAQNGMTTFGRKLNHFSVAGSDRKFHPAKAVMTREGILLSSPYVKTPVAARYAFDDFVTGELYNTEGLPASSFRTDDW